MDDFETLQSRPSPTAERPLAGMTVLIVEDSRYASEAMRLLCLRSGARIRRADCLVSARRHLGVYRPSAIIVDMGLPDGSGEELIHDLAGASPRVPVILGISADPDVRAAALAAGADGFLEKPVHGLAAFQEAVLAPLPPHARSNAVRALPRTAVQPDRIAFRDDLAGIAPALSPESDPATLGYAARFLTGVARSAQDGPLEQAARALVRADAGGPRAGRRLRRLAGIVEERLSAAGGL